MKTLALTIIALTVSVVLLAQGTMPFKYQAVLRTENGEIISDQDVTLRFSILSGESFDFLQYAETYDVTTNEYGMVALNIGEGMPAEGDFEDINWSEEFTWLKVEIDADGGMNFTEMGTSRLLAVPFANYAAKADYTKLDNLPELFDGNYNSLTNIPESFNGDYNSLSNLPELFDGNYNELTNLPALFDGEWTSINGKPDFASVALTGNYLELTNLPVLFNGDYSELTNAPVLFSGDYSDLTNKPVLFDGTWTNLSGKPTFQTVAYSGSYNDLEDLPILFSGNYNDLSNKPSLFSGNYNNLTNKPVLFDGTWTSLTGKPIFATVATSGSYNDLSSKPNLTIFATKDMGGQNITNLAEPVVATDAATKEYVDELEAKLSALEEMLVSYGTMVKDYDGNIYNTVVIGTQTWMAENLRTTHTTDGTPIAVYYSANNNSANDESYGLLYSWATTMNGAASSSANPSGVAGICPTGWHVPSDSEWKTLETYLGMEAAQLNLTLTWRGTDQGTQLKPGGSTGFNADYAGIRYNINNFSQFDSYASYWTSTQSNTTTAYYRLLNIDETGIFRNPLIKDYYMSVRCVKD
jgi:uncharacterized protein (TIGR02145 family)